MAIDRHLELSSKFMEMGVSLMQEGKNSRDMVVSQSGALLILISGLMLDEKDMALMSQIGLLFSSKKTLDGMEKSQHSYFEYLKEKNKTETYDDFLKRINKLREDNEDKE